jgi:hypothetical protein
MRVDEGAGFASRDFTDLGKRFAIDVLRRDGQQLVRLVTQLAPTFAGMDVPWAPADDSYHTYELRYDPGLQTADLWIDGTQRVTGYRGCRSFRATVTSCSVLRCMSDEDSVFDSLANSSSIRATVMHRAEDDSLRPRRRSPPALPEAPC